MPRRLGKKTPLSEMTKHGPAWGLNPPPDWKVMALHKKGMTAGQIAKGLGTTSTYVRGVLSRNPRAVGKTVMARPSFEYAHEEVTDFDKIMKQHPEATIRTVTAGDHQLRISYWGRPVNGRHPHSQLVSILHPRGEGKPCAFMAAIRKTGKLKELLEKGRLSIKNISPFAGKVQYLPCPNCGTQTPVSRANVSLKCSSCGMPLRSIRVRKNITRRK